MYFAWWRGGGSRLCRCGVSRDHVSMSRVMFSLKGKESYDCARHVSACGEEMFCFNREEKRMRRSVVSLEP